MPLTQFIGSARKDDVTISIEPCRWPDHRLAQRTRTRGTHMATDITIDGIEADFDVLDDWEDRYRYVIELGRKLQPLPAADKTDANKVRGCASQVWIKTQATGATDGDVVSASGPVLTFAGQSDSHIVQGLIAILLALVDNKPASDIEAMDIAARFAKLGLKEHLTPQRSNGLASMVERIKADARAALAATPAGS